ncbi:replication factor-A protein 1 [Striga asiatica]|uniref:Replication factor-A protein 1 n=1 Tax=Striga asiatica TaxID=4170 RepID=A0A5A7QE07_STRAF|nr:replication factor-A protein 1 [Striga asiatica]
MSRKFVQIEEVDDKTSACTAIVQVVEKSHIQISKPLKNLPYRRYLLTDSEGTKVSVVVYSADLDVVSERLVPYKRYYVSNAIVGPVDTRYQVGLSLTTRLPTCILINPPMQEAVNLKQWYIEHKVEVAHLIENKAFMNASVLLPPPNGNHVVTVQAALRSLNKTVKATWVTNQKSLWFSACGHCHTKLEVPVGWEVKCTICQEQTNVEPRCRFVVAINDGTGVLNALIYAEDTEKLIPFTALQIYEAGKDGNNLLSEIITGFWKKTMTCFVRHYESDYGYLMDNYPIENQVAADEHLITPTGSQIPFAGDESPYSRMEREAEKQSAGSSTKRKLIFSGPSDSKGETNQEKSSKKHIGTSNVEEKDFNPKKPCF